MRSLMQTIFLAVVFLWAWPAAAQQQQNCSNYSIVVNSPEDKLMLAVNGSDDPNAKIAVLEKFAQEHADSAYMPCVQQQLTKNYGALKQYDKAIAASQKAVAANYLDVPFLESALQAYTASGQASDAAFDIIMKAGPQIKAETVIFKNTNETDAQFQEEQKNALDQARNDAAYMTFSFFQLLPRVTDVSSRIKLLDQFSQAYADFAPQEGGIVNYQYAVAYMQANQMEKADEYGEKSIAADPNNIEALNLVAYNYAFRARTNQDKATGYAQKVLTLIPGEKKPDGFSDDQFKSKQNQQEGMAHLTLGYLGLVKLGPSHRVSGAVQQLQTAANLLSANPELQGQAYYFLGYAYEDLYPPQHHHAMEALEHAAGLQSSMQSQARDLLAKVKRAAH